VKLSQQEDL